MNDKASDPGHARGATEGTTQPADAEGVSAPEPLRADAQEMAARLASPHTGRADAASQESASQGSAGRVTDDSQGSGAPRLGSAAGGTAGSTSGGAESARASGPRPVSGQVSGFGTYARQRPPERFTQTELIAGLLTLVWVIAVGTFFGLTGGVVTEGGALTAVMTLLAVFLPVAMIWVAALTPAPYATCAKRRSACRPPWTACAQAYVQHSQATALGIRPAVEKKLDEIAAAQRQTEATLATFTSRRDHSKWSRLPTARRR